MNYAAGSCWQLPGRAICLVAFALLLLPQLGGAASLETSQELSNEGYYQLSWEADEPVRLVEAPTESFSVPTVLYSGGDSGHVVSGKPDGTWHYRLESLDGSSLLAGPLEVTVSHHSLARAIGFFAVGGVVFAATLALILLPQFRSDERAQ